MACLLLLAASSSLTFPFDPGAHAVGSFDVGSIKHPNVSLVPWHACVLFPRPLVAAVSNDASDGNATSLPVLVFVTGFAGQVSTEQYRTFLTLIASHGLVVVALDRRSSLIPYVNYTELAATLDGPLTYASDGGLGADLRRAGAAAPPHASLLLVGGHSAGNHVIVRRLTSFGCGRAGGVVLLDPVDVRIRRESNELSSLLPVC
jgi:hypothetical protein